ncbi:MAG: hypothetical protein ABIM49_03790 [candidate division WOR-3 bacterium]
MDNLTLTFGTIVAIVVFMFTICFLTIFGVFLGFKLAKLTEKFIIKRKEVENERGIRKD